jgi:hypothetical protein
MEVGINKGKSGHGMSSLAAFLRCILSFSGSLLPRSSYVDNHLPVNQDVHYIAAEIRFISIVFTGKEDYNNFVKLNSIMFLKYCCFSS